VELPLVFLGDMVGVMVVMDTLGLMIAIRSRPRSRILEGLASLSRFSLFYELDGLEEVISCVTKTFLG
jgi:hypothetical protein